MFDEEISSWLDPNGILRSDAVVDEAIFGSSPLLVFSQRSDAVVDLSVWRTQAERFFDATVGLTIPKKYSADLPETDVAPVVIASANRSGVVRLVYSRPADDRDYARAEEAERATPQMSGMAVLARRCGQVWLVAEQNDNDEIALLLAAILASVFLGPIVHLDSIFGVRGARERLARYR